MNKEYDFTKEEDKIAACKEYARCRQNYPSSSAEERMDELDELANAAGLTFFMMNENVYNMPHAFVSPRYELVDLEQDLTVEESPVTLTIKVRSGMHSDGFLTIVAKGDEVLNEKGWDYGCNCSCQRSDISEQTPYVPDILQELIDKYHVDEFSVEAGVNVFARAEEKAAKVERFKEKFCTDLKLYGGTAEFADAVATISGTEDGLKQ